MATMATTVTIIKTVTDPVSYLENHLSLICLRVSKHIRKKAVVARRNIQSHHLPRTTVVVPTALLGSLKALELAADHFQEDRFREEGAGAVSRMTALRT